MLIGGLFFAVSVTNKLKWRSMKQSCAFVTGRVVGLVEDSDLDTHLEIEYELRGATRRYISDYGGSTFKNVGDRVTVLIDLKHGREEHYSIVNRWLFTLVPILFGGLTIWLGLSSLAQ